jgi:DsbC/DsbD-like thiol-disulfide interchange protein
LRSSKIRSRLSLLFALCLACAVMGATEFSSRVLAQDAAAPMPAATVVKPHVFISVDRVPRGTEFQAAIVVDIARGYHMNSNKPTDPYLIPTTLKADMPAGIELRDTIYPAGKMEKFAFSPDKPLNVYTGSVTLRLRLAAQASAALGAATIPVTLRYQACNDSACLPPVRVPISVKLEVAAAGTKAHAVHAEVFPAESPKN